VQTKIKKLTVSFLSTFSIFNISIYSISFFLKLASPIIVIIITVVPVIIVSLEFLVSLVTVIAAITAPVPVTLSTIVAIPKAANIRCIGKFKLVAGNAA
jgi:hypothetical protein